MDMKIKDKFIKLSKKYFSNAELIESPFITVTLENRRDFGQTRFSSAMCNGCTGRGKKRPLF